MCDVIVTSQYWTSEKSFIDIFHAWAIATSLRRQFASRSWCISRNPPGDALFGDISHWAACTQASGRDWTGRNWPTCPDWTRPITACYDLLRLATTRQSSRLVAAISLVECRHNEINKIRSRPVVARSDRSCEDGQTRDELWQDETSRAKTWQVVPRRVGTRGVRRGPSPPTIGILSRPDTCMHAS